MIRNVSKKDADKVYRRLLIAEASIQSIPSTVVGYYGVTMWSADEEKFWVTIYKQITSMRLKIKKKYKL